MKTLVRWHSNERVDLSDFDDATGLLDLFDEMRQTIGFTMAEGRALGADNGATETRILSGFDVTNIDAAAAGGPGFLTLNSGAAIFKLLEEGELKFGLLFGSEGDASQNLDFSGLANGDYAIWVRAVHVDGTQENRIKWDATGVTEVVENVNTRRVASWQQQITAFNAAAPSGGDWVKVWKVTKGAGPTISATLDMRHFYFEGDADSTVSQWAQEWGDGANDRNADRALYGVKDLHRAFQLLRRQVTDILGAASGHWGSAVPRHLTDLAVEHMAGGEHGSINASRVRTPAASGDLGLTLGDLAFPFTEELGYLTSAAQAFHGRLFKGDAVTFEGSGRIARSHRFYDDFTQYGNWISYATLPAEPYSATRVGTTEFKVIQTGTTKVHGGVLSIETSAGANDNGVLFAPSTWILDSDVANLGFFARLATDNAEPTTRVDKFGIYSHTAGSYFVNFVRDQGTLGNGNWWLEFWDGATYVRSDTGITPAADTFLNFYFLILDHERIAYWVTGMAYNTPTIVNINPATLAALGQRSKPILIVQNNGTAASIETYLDAWEAWDCESLSGISGLNA